MGTSLFVEFFDYNCPYCRQVASVVTKAEESDPKLRVAYKEFPILGPNSIVAAKAALAANKQGKYVAFHRALGEVHGAVDSGKVNGSRGRGRTGYGSSQRRHERPAIEALIAKNLYRLRSAPHQRHARLCCR